MPYIPKTDRDKFRMVLDAVNVAIEKHGISNGELNYLMTRLALAYIYQHGTSYNTLSDVIKAFECAKLEFYRRHVVPYEDKKIIQNGDV